MSRYWQIITNYGCAFYEYWEAQHVIGILGEVLKQQSTVIDTCDTYLREHRAVMVSETEYDVMAVVKYDEQVTETDIRRDCEEVLTRK